MTYEEKYGIVEGEETKAFHQRRQMFCIRADKVFIADPFVPYSHAVWFEKKGWINSEKDADMDLIVRGIKDKDGDLYFYVGYDFLVTRKAEKILFSHLSELKQRLDLKDTAQIFGGLIKSEGGKKWMSRKTYGTIKEWE